MSDAFYVMFWTALLPKIEEISIADEMKEWSARLGVPQTEFYKDRPHLNKSITDLLGK